MNKINSIFGSAACIGLCLALSACMPRVPTLTPLQVQLMQTKTYNVTKKQLFNAVVAVLQNQSYTIESANLNTGFVRANSATHQQAESIFRELSSAPPLPNYFFAASAFVTQLGPHKAHVRISIVKSAGSATTPVLKAPVYQQFFTHVQQELFVSTGLTPTSDKTAHKPHTK